MLIFFLILTFKSSESRPQGAQIRAVIYVHPFYDNFDDNIVFLSSYWSKTIKREKGREGKRTSCKYERESCPKVTKCCTNIISPQINMVNVLKHWSE